MDNYTVLLVDDEEEVIQVILKKINWEELGFSVIGYANNGVKALEMVEEFQPDVVMTDIRMPYMDGMELCKQIREDFPATKILLFTGFDEFEYAKEAVHLEIEEYILKPLNSAELTGVFTRLKTKLDQEISEKRNVEVLQKYYLESLPLLQTNFYVTLIEGQVQERDLEKYLKDYQISFPGPFYCCAVIHTSSSRVPEHMNFLLLSTSVARQAEEFLGKKWSAKSFSYLGNTILLVQMKSGYDNPEFTDDCDRFCRYTRRMIGAVVTVGIGHVCGDILELARSYSSAREAVSYRALYGAGKAINIREIAPKEKSTGEENDTELLKLFRTVRVGTDREISDAAGRYLKYIFSADSSLEQHHVTVMELVSAMYKFSNKNDIQVDGFSGDMKNLYSRLLEMDPEGLQTWFTGLCQAFHAKLFHARKQSTQSIVGRAEEYVKNHYMEEGLSLDVICQALGVSNSYFSTIFKKETGKSFVGYLTDYRMDQALKLLIETNEKSYMIAKQTGYTDPNYFSYVFKRRFGVSPSKYRTEHTDSEK